MSVVAERLSQINLSESQVHDNLALFPLISEGNVEPHYLLLDEALEGGCARVTEVSDSGSVPELKFVNDCDQPVLLLDGEELMGAKQNRILNLTVLAPAHKARKPQRVMPKHSSRRSPALAWNSFPRLGRVKTCGCKVNDSPVGRWLPRIV